MSFNDKVVIVTGSSSGIGAAIALKFSEEGAQVVITGRNEAKLKNVEQECSAAGKAPLSIIGDISNEAVAKKLIDDTISKFGKIDVLINNAGILRIASVLSGKLLQSFDELINTNLRPIVHLTALSAPYLKETKGSLINISSAAAHKVVPGFSCYGLSKAALNHFTKNVALELAGSGIRVNSISPGPVTTDIAANSGASMEEIAASRTWRTPLERVSSSDEVAHLALYLSSEKAVGITGADFVLDNGTLLS